MRGRATLPSVVVLLALAAAVVFGGTQGAVAAQGQAILAGQTNTESTETLVQNTSLSVPNCQTDPSGGLEGCGREGVEGFGTVIAVYGQGGNWGLFGYGDSFGVEGNSDTGIGVEGDTTAENQNGVYGHAKNSNGSGVYGQNDGTGFGVAGRATSTSGGTGVMGDAPNSANGIGVEANSATGTALLVNGKAAFSTAGKAVIASGKKSVTVHLGGVTTGDLVLATVQGSGSFYVKNAAAGSGQFTIYINKASRAPATVKVAYFVLN